MDGSVQIQVDRRRFCQSQLLVHQVDQASGAQIFVIEERQGSQSVQPAGSQPLLPILGKRPHQRGHAGCQDVHGGIISAHADG